MCVLGRYAAHSSCKPIQGDLLPNSSQATCGSVADVCSNGATMPIPSKAAYIGPKVAHQCNITLKNICPGNSIASALAEENGQHAACALTDPCVRMNKIMQIYLHVVVCCSGPAAGLNMLDPDPDSTRHSPTCIDFMSGLVFLSAFSVQCSVHWVT